MNNFKNKLKSIFAIKRQDFKEVNYRCINCGFPLKELWKSYSPTIQKLVKCQKCLKIADNLIVSWCSSLLFAFSSFN